VNRGGCDATCSRAPRSGKPSRSITGSTRRAGSRSSSCRRRDRAELERQPPKQQPEEHGDLARQVEDESLRWRRRRLVRTQLSVFRRDGILTRDGSFRQRSQARAASARSRSARSTSRARRLIVEALGPGDPQRGAIGSRSNRAAGAGRPRLDPREATPTARHVWTSRAYVVGALRSDEAAALAGRTCRECLRASSRPRPHQVSCHSVGQPTTARAARMAASSVCSEMHAERRRRSSLERVGASSAEVRPRCRRQLARPRPSRGRHA